MSKAIITSAEVVELLRKKHPYPEWVFFDELRCGSGYATTSQKRIDAWALNCYPSTNHLKVAYEIKVYRQDFLNELKQPKKRKEALKFSNQFYFIAPEGIIKKDEIPNECGYIEISAKKILKIIKEAPVRECKEPTWVFVSSLGRRVVKQEGVDFTKLTDDIIYTLYNSIINKKKNGSEMLLFNFLEKERIKRAQKEYNKETSARRSLYRLYNKLRKENQNITLEEVKKIWKETLGKKHKYNY